MITNLLLIANKQSGDQAQGLQAIFDILDDGGINYTLFDITKKSDIPGLVKNLTSDTYDIVAIYSGDGTILKVAHQLYDKNIPLLILPGGTANALATSFGQPMSPLKAMQSVANGHYKLVKHDVAFWNDKPFIYDFHYGIVAQTIPRTDRAAKQRVGVLAYAFEGLRQLRRVQLQQFALELDKKRVETKGSLCYIANSGLPRLLGKPLFLPARGTDGKLGVAICRTDRVGPLLLWYIGRILGISIAKSPVRLYQAKSVRVIEAPRQAFCDDESVSVTPPVNLTVKPMAMPVIVPLNEPLSARFKNVWAIIFTQFFRFTDHARRLVFGMSSVRFSQLDDNLFIGGQPGKRGVKTLQQWGVDAIVSLQTRLPRQMPKGITLLHLPTKDRTAVSIADLQRGVGFITEHVSKGHKVYVHCHVGEGRSAMLMVAYLLSKGMFLNDALAYIKKHRTFIRPNPRQIKRLREFARQLRTKNLKSNDSSQN